VDSAGNFYIADSGNNVVRKVAAATGVITTFAGCCETTGGPGTGSYTGDGGPATSATMNDPTGVAADSAGNLYIADEANEVIRKVAASTGIITTVAGVRFAIGDSGDGGPATSAAIAFANGVAVDSAGNFYIASTGNCVVRKVTVSTGIITTVAGKFVNNGSNGNEDCGYSGDGGPATGAELNEIYGIALDSSGNIYIADIVNNRIRKVTAATGIITTVAGIGGGNGYSGDGGPATSAEMNGPISVSVDSAGNLYIADQYNQVIRKVTSATGVINTMAGTPTIGGYSGDGGPRHQRGDGSPLWRCGGLVRRHLHLGSEQ
jgi:hypothetical protein